MGEISKVQKSLIHIGVQELGIDDDTYRLMLAGYGVDTCKDLQYSQASALIDDLVRKGFKIRGKRNRKDFAGSSVRRVADSKVVYLPTRQQLSMIEHLRQDIIWRFSDGYQRWVRKFLGRTYIKNEKEAQKVIEALKGMKRRQGESETRPSKHWGHEQK